MSDINKTILIAEDEEPMLKALADKYRVEGFNVLEANNGKDGLVLAMKKKPDMILLDIIMPKLDGIDMMKKIRKEGGEWGKKVPIVMLTNLSDPDSVSEAAEHQVYDFLVKTDWRLDDVLKLTKEKLGLAG